METDSSPDIEAQNKSGHDRTGKDVRLPSFRLAQIMKGYVQKLGTGRAEFASASPNCHISVTPERVRGNISVITHNSGLILIFPILNPYVV